MTAHTGCWALDLRWPGRRSSGQTQGPCGGMSLPSLQQPLVLQLEGKRGKLGVALRSFSAIFNLPRKRCVQDRSSAARWGSSRDESPRPARAGGRELSSRSSTAPSGPRRGLSPPAGSSRNSAAKVAWKDSSPLLPLPLSLSLPGRRKVALGVPESLDHPHQARAAP